MAASYRLIGFAVLTIALAACGDLPVRSAPIRQVTAPLPPVVGPYDGFLTARDEPALIKTARLQVGTPYRWGGDQPQTGFDCSGLVQYVYAMHGRSVPRTTEGQYERAQPVSFAAIKPGDLVFFRVHNRVGHVGIYLGEQRFIHAPATGKNVSYATLDDPFWHRRFIGAGRL